MPRLSAARSGDEAAVAGRSRASVSTRETGSMMEKKGEEVDGGVGERW